MRPRIAFVAVWFAGTVGYLVLAGSFSSDELVTAALLGGLGAVFRAAMLREGARRFAFERPALGVVGGALAGLPAATLRVARRLVEALLHGAEGRRIEQPFHRGRLHDTRDAGRRAVVALAASLAPDSYVLRLPLDEETIVFHAITASVPSNDPRWPR